MRKNIYIFFINMFNIFKILTFKFIDSQGLRFNI